MVVNMYQHIGKVVIKILQGSAVTLTKLGGLTIHPPVANFLRYICAKNYENWLEVDKVIAKIIRLTFFGPPCTCVCLSDCLAGASANEQCSACGVHSHVYDVTTTTCDGRYSLRRSWNVNWHHFVLCRDNVSCSSVRISFQNYTVFVLVFWLVRSVHQIFTTLTVYCNLHTLYS